MLSQTPCGAACALKTFGISAVRAILCDRGSVRISPIILAAAHRFLILDMLQGHKHSPVEQCCEPISRRKQETQRQACDHDLAVEVLFRRKLDNAETSS